MSPKNTVYDIDVVQRADGTVDGVGVLLGIDLLLRIDICEQIEQLAVRPGFESKEGLECVHGVMWGFYFQGTASLAAIKTNAIANPRRNPA